MRALSSRSLSIRPTCSRVYDGGLYIQSRRVWARTSENILDKQGLINHRELPPAGARDPHAKHQLAKPKLKGQVNDKRYKTSVAMDVALSTAQIILDSLNVFVCP